MEMRKFESFPADDPSKNGEDSSTSKVSQTASEIEALRVHQIKDNLNIDPTALSLRHCQPQLLSLTPDADRTDQPIFSCFSPDFFEDEELSSGDEVKVGVKRTRSGREHLSVSKKFAYEKLKYGVLPRGLDIQKHVEGQYCQTTMFNVNDKIEFLCQDSGIRGCWFRCTVLEVSRRQIRIRYDDIDDDDGCGNLEEWVPAFRLASPDKFGMRCRGRPTVRPPVKCIQVDGVFKVGAPVDAWWSDGWWEGVVTGKSSCNDIHQVYIPGENIFLNIDKKKLRISRDWVGNQWMDVEGRPDILSVLSASVSLDSKLSVSSAITKEAKSDGSNDIKLSVVYEMQDRDCASGDQEQVLEYENSENADKQVDDCDMRDNADSHLTDVSVTLAKLEHSENDKDKLAEVETNERQLEAEL